MHVLMKISNNNKLYDLLIKSCLVHPHMLSLLFYFLSVWIFEPKYCDDIYIYDNNF